MRSQTLSTLAQLNDAPWFSCVGIKDTEAVEVLSSWTQAVESCASPEWEDLCLEAVNQYCARVFERSPDRYRLWNEVVDEVKPHALDLVRSKTDLVVVQHELPKVFVDTVNWDVLHLLMEAEYADVYPPGYYTSQAYWYMKGHFPCGWHGDFPEGRLVVF